MIKNLYVFILCLFGHYLLHAQPDFKILEFSVQGDSILDMELGDLDGDGYNNIYFAVANSAQIQRLTNAAGALSVSNYIQLPNTQKLFVRPLNYEGADDLIIKVNGKNLQTTYGKDVNNAEKKIGPELNDWSTKDVSLVATIPYNRNQNPPRFINLHLMKNVGNNLDIWTSSSSSFNIISAKYEDGTNVDDYNEICIVEKSLNKFTCYFTTSKSVGFMDINFTDPYSYTTNWKVTELLPLPGIIKCTAHKSTTGDQYLYMLTKDSIFTMNLTKNNELKSIAIDMTQPSELIIGNFDNKGKDDIIIKDGTKLWIINDGAERTGQMLWIQESKPIFEMVVSDFNKDSITDLVYVLQGEKTLKGRLSDLKSSIGETIKNKTIYTYPNPSIGSISLCEDCKIKAIYDSKGNKILSNTNPSGMLNTLKSGIYYFAIEKRNEIVMHKHIILTQ